LTNKKKWNIIQITFSAQRKKMADNLSTKDISEKLQERVLNSIQNVKGWGSVEIFIQDYKITQITEKNIIKPNVVNLE
jgi:hypothetical protein